MKSQLRFIPFLFVLLAFVSCLEPEDPIVDLPSTSGPELRDNQVIWTWMEQYLKVEKDLPGFRPAPTCRAMAYIQMGAYETLMPGTNEYRPLSEVITGFPETNLRYHPWQIDWEIALNAYFARTLKFFMFNASELQRHDIDYLENSQLQKLRVGVPDGIVLTSIEWGQQVANTVIDYSETDREGALQCRVAQPVQYFPPINNGLWVSTESVNGGAMFPYWGKVRTFSAVQGQLVALPPSAPYSEDPASEYYAQNLEVANAVNNMTPENHWIAEFWSDDLTGMTFSPPARVFAIANQVVSLEKMSLLETAQMYCVLGIAINDAAVACWNSKYIYNTERPETYIQKHIDPNFAAILGEAIGTPGMNPSFPGYPSGHSTFAGVNWRIFEHFFGPSYDFTDLCHYGRVEFEGTPRTFHSWKQLAEENAFSRIPLGVHIRQDCTEGLRLGNSIAVSALDLEFKR